MNDTDAGLRAAREQTIDALCGGFARDAITLPELERRLDRARSARTRQELRTLLADIAPAATAAIGTTAVDPSGSTGGPAGTGVTRAGGRAAATGGAEPGGDRTVAMPAGVPPTGSHLAFAVMGGTRRAGRWAPPGSMLAVALMGAVELDFRDAVIGRGEVIDINVFTFWGGIEITVPPDVHVDTRGFALMGGFEQVAEEDPSPRRDAPAGAPPPDAPTIRVNGLAIMGSVEVKMKDRGSGSAGERKRQR